jgi:hypothetical protein
MKQTINILILMFLCVSMGFGARKEHPVPDFTAGDEPFEDASFNVGPTGLRGWCYRKGSDTSLATQIMVKTVATNSPADGMLVVGDVILGCCGDGSNPKPFVTDARRTIADAITEAEARNPANLSLLRWRDGNTSTVTLQLEAMGAYAPTAPYNCKKTRKILLKALNAFYVKDDPGSWNLGVLVFLAADDPTISGNDRYQEKAKEWAHQLILSPVEIQELKSDRNPTQGKIAWMHGYRLIVLAEYYMHTKDEAVFPTLEAYAICYAKNQSWFGTTGHQYAQKRPDGGNNGAMSGYGAINGSGVAGFYGMSLAREAGVKNPLLDEAIHRSECFFGSYAGKSGIPYGEHSYSPNFEMYDMNGKHGTATLAFSLLQDRKKETQFYGRMTMASGKDRQDGHAGPFFNYVWPSLGAAAVGELPAVYYFRETRWLFELSREWDGGVAFDHFGYGNIYRNFPAALTTVLTYALPLRQLHMTGRGHDRSRWPSKDEIRDVVSAVNFDADSRTVKQLMGDLSNWAPLVRCNAAEALALRLKDSEHKDQILSYLHQRVKDQTIDAYTRNAICLVLETINDAASISVLADILSDKSSYVRFGAAKALRQFKRDDIIPHINKILAAASTKRPIFPINDDDSVAAGSRPDINIAFLCWQCIWPQRGAEC